ncbi:MAG: M23 family metallopeptidase [Oligoflexia bacterium]|nr:M23 family metallopeptidase [Oligoflexia bacterium]
MKIILSILPVLLTLLFYSCSNTVEQSPPGSNPGGAASGIECGTETVTSSMPEIKLPYQNGTSHLVTQGYNGDYSHDSAPHNLALDFEMPENTAIVAVAAGKVMALKEDSDTNCTSSSCADSANYVLVDHGNGVYGRYVHMCKNCVDVETGDLVEAGETIARSGNTGWSTDPHLHFEMNSFISGCSLSYPFQEVPGTGIPVAGNTCTSGNDGSHGVSYESSKITGNAFAANGIILTSQTPWYISAGDSIRFQGSVTTGETSVTVFIMGPYGGNPLDYETGVVDSSGNFNFTFVPDLTAGSYTIAIDASSDGSFSSPSSLTFLVE